MSQDEIDLARRLIEAWNRGEDLHELGLVSDDVEYVSPDDAMEPGTRRGRDGWDRAMRGVFESYDDAHIEVGQLHDAGGGVIVGAVTLRVRGRGSGVRLDQAQTYALTVRDGRAVRFEWTWGHEALRERYGIDDQAAAGSGSG